MLGEVEGPRLGTIEASPDGTVVGFWLGDTDGRLLGEDVGDSETVGSELGTALRTGVG
jgi:hypothetical protein